MPPTDRPPAGTDERAFAQASAAPPVKSVTILCQDVPYPPTHGGLVDLWGLIRGLHAKGVRVQLVCWFKKKQRMSPAVRDRLKLFADEVVEVPLRNGLWRLLFLNRPPRVLARKPSRTEYRRLRASVEAFVPEWIVLDYWLGFLTAEMLRRDLGRPLLYRSQNVDFRYYRELLRVARGMLKLRLWANATRLFRLESELRRSADLVADICDADREEWTELGAPGAGLVLPPLWFEPSRSWDRKRTRDIDLLFVGNLTAPNNLEGLEWFLREVLPILRAGMGDQRARVVFAGSNPSARFVERCRLAGVDCAQNPADVTDFYARARAVINPVRRGSGVNLKMIEAFTLGMDVLATRAALRGLPRALEPYFRCAGDSSEQFAAAALTLLSGEPAAVDMAERARIVEREFGLTKLQGLLDEMRRRAFGLGAADPQGALPERSSR